MYKSFFGLRANPFNVNPDPRFLYMTHHTKEALACLGYGIKNRKGFILLTGEVGTGKTTLLNRILEWLKMQRIASAFVFNPRLSVMQFFDFMMTDFGVHCQATEKSGILLNFNQWLLDRYRRGEGACVIIDEAQNLSTELLEEIRLLTNLETSSEKLLQVVLSGQPELEHKLKQPELRQLRQRISLRCRTYPLTLQETAEYIEQRLRLAGANGARIFEAETISEIYKYAQGIPRVTNLLCEHALISGFVDQKKPIPVETIQDVAREFDLQVPGDSFPLQTGASGENLSMMEAVRMVSQKRKEELSQPMSSEETKL